MSYLDLPRMHLSGEFFANPSTINNEAVNYDNGQPLGSINPALPGAVGWNPPGQARWTMSLVVNTLRDPGGNLLTPADTSPDPLLGATLASVDLPNTAKLVDLDPQQQMVSQIWGMSVALTLSDGTQVFTASVLECGLTEPWPRGGGAAGGIAGTSGTYQTVLQNVTWGPDVPSSSPTLNALQSQVQANGDQLSIKWVVDGYNGTQGSGFGYGRIVATLGPYTTGEPVHVVAQRRLEPGGGNTWFAPFQVDATRSVLVLDLGNALGPTPTGTDSTLLYVLLDPYAPQPLPVAATQAQPLNYDSDAYLNQAGIFEVPLAAAELTAIEDGAVMVVDGTQTNILMEPASGLVVVPDLPVLSTRLSQGDTATVNVYACVFGVPQSSYEIDFRLVPISNSDTTANPPMVGSDPPDGLQFASSVTTGDDGVATLTLTAGDVSPQPAYRGSVDGQVYHLIGTWWPSQLIGAGLPAMSILVFGPYTPGDPVTWSGDIQPMMVQYARLYPGMRDILDISDYDTLMSTPPGMTQTAVQLVSTVLNLPITDPNHMPVTRDFSPARLAAFNAWVAGGYAQGDTDPPPPPPTTEQPSPPERVLSGSIKSALVVN